MGGFIAIKLAIEYPEILDKLVSECLPVWMHIEADFNPRGNVHTVINISHGVKKIN